MKHCGYSSFISSICFGGASTALGMSAKLTFPQTLSPIIYGISDFIHYYVAVGLASC